MTMRLIYEPNGKAREYSPLALNVYTRGCDHACNYCYCSTIGAWSETPHPRNLHGLAGDAEQATRQVLLSFMGDPYCAAERIHRNTRMALGVLARARCSVAILTKGGTRCLDDLGIFRAWPDGRCQVGATLTFLNPARSIAHEPGAALPADRLDALQHLHGAGVTTWASIEPVIDARESLAVIRASLPYVDAYKVGKLNHRGSTVDYRAFGVAVVDMIRAAGRALYVKVDLRPYFPTGYLRAEEIALDALVVQDRPIA